MDSILIDEARTPLIISGPAEAPSEKYFKACKLADALARDVHYTVDEKQRNVLLTDDGYEAAEDVLQVGDLYDPREQWASYLINAIKAKELFLRDVSYIVRGGEVIIVDEFTGRTMPGRRWGDGLHQAIEAKEKMAIQNESVTLASISYQVCVLFGGGCVVWRLRWGAEMRVWVWVTYLFEHNNNNTHTHTHTHTYNTCTHMHATLHPHNLSCNPTHPPTHPPTQFSTPTTITTTITELFPQLPQAGRHDRYSRNRS